MKLANCISLTLLTVLLIPNMAHAHAGHAAGWEAGLLHPFTGLDHLSALIAVGIWAKQMGGRAVWCVPLAFICVMALGGLLGIAAIPLHFIEGGVLASVLVLGALIASQARYSLPVSMSLVSLFALFHGYAHGVEMPHNASGFGYALGFMLSTAALHLTGITIASALARSGLRILGMLIALIGFAGFYA